MASIRLSEKHGVNPTVPRCYFCGDDKNEVLLLGKLKGDAEAPRGVYDMEPCDTCKGYMEQGIIVISVLDGDCEDPSNPYRTGGWAVLKEEALEHMGINPPELKAQILKARWAFVPDEAWDLMEIPRVGIKESGNA